MFKPISSFLLVFVLLLSTTQVVLCQNDDPVVVPFSPWEEDIFVPQTLPEIIKEKQTCMSSIQVSISTNEDGHQCNAAQFRLYANSTVLRDLKDDVDIINLNNSNTNSFDELGAIQLTAKELNPNQFDIGGHRSTKINLNQALAQKVISASSDTTVTLYLECITPIDEDRGWGFGGCHQGVPYVEITRVEHGVETIIYKNTPIISMSDNKVKLTSFDPCFNPLN